MSVQDTGAEDVLDDTPKSLILHLVKQLTKGQDLSRVLIPTYFLEPRSLLEKYTDLFSHPQYVLGASRLADPMARLLAVLRWYVSSWHVRPKGCKKPYNPLLGEEFLAYWDHPDGSRSNFVAEQVSHHPPVSAVYLENRENNFTLNAQIYTKSKFLGNSAASINMGEMHLTLCNLGEEYVINFPTAYACGLFIGSLRMELGGTQTLVCQKTGLAAEIEFRTKPMLGGEVNRLRGKVFRIAEPSKELYTFEGRWDGSVTLKNERTGATEVLFDAATAEVQHKFVRPIAHQGPWESRRIWHAMTDALRKGNHDGATKHKTDLEEAQRARRKWREDHHSPYRTKFFRLDEKTHQRWIFRAINTTPYDPERELVERAQRLAISRAAIAAGAAADGAAAAAHLADDSADAKAPEDEGYSPHDMVREFQRDDGGPLFSPKPTEHERNVALLSTPALPGESPTARQPPAAYH